MLIALLIAFLAAVAAEIFDVTMTEKGLKAGVALERNTWLVGSKPSAKALYLRDLLIIVPFLALGLVAVHFKHPIVYGFIAPLAVRAVQHIKGGLEWKKLLSKE